MNINLHLSGELESYINSLIKRGFAASKTEAARMVIAQQYEKNKVRSTDPDLDAWQRASMKAVWDNPADNAAEEFYIKKYLGGKKPK